jgi:flagellar hook-associated protein 3 FlgL
MRISSSTLYDVNVANLNLQQSKLLQTQQQLASGRRMLSPADDPAAAARALDVSQADAVNTQYGKNLDTAKSYLSLSESTLQSVTDLLQYIQTKAASAGNMTLSNSDRGLIATDIQSKLDELKGLANSTDGTGNYLFSGFQGKTQPFVDTAAGVQYAGDNGQRLIQGSASRQLPMSDSGAGIFMNIKNGNGTFVSQATAANTGSSLVSLDAVVNPALLTGNNYQLTFNVAAGVTTYDVMNTTTGLPVSAGTPYVSGQQIVFDGMQLIIQGAPGSGDQFTVVPSTSESVFTTISNLVTTLNTPITPGVVASATQYNASLSNTQNGLDRSLNSVLTTRASLGSRLNEVDALQSTGADLGLQHQQTLSLLQDLDYNKAITDLTRQQTSLQAAQKSFLQVQNMSIFNYIN